MTTDNLKQDKERKKVQQPNFTRADAHKKNRLGAGWRKPKGWQNKIRLHKKGYRVTVKPGFGTPTELQGCTTSGLAIITIHNIEEMKALDTKTQAALIANVGRRKKEELIDYAQKNKVELVNLSVKAFQEKSKALKAEKEATKEAAKAKADKLKAAEEKAKAAKEKAKADKAAKEKAEAESAEKAKTDEEKAEDAQQSKILGSVDAKKEAEKKEKEKVLTSKKGF